MTTLVIDASVAIKWIIEEQGTIEALELSRRATLIAPDLIMIECANTLWKKCQRGELSKDEAAFAARLLQAAEIELIPTRSLCEAATRLSIELGHPAYDCLYLALAVANECPFVTADEGFLRKLGQSRRGPFRGRAISLTEATAGNL
ncbi:MAG TPA: type II toxin-antitoxin system VapC family toxin [Stellaceae bacterium]|nr:type II toxin-antitoxin system VapC family toxin [Stellaceae bacterium]